jgi:menaquinone-dependent protoporphyrinogen oxidase
MPQRLFMHGRGNARGVQTAMASVILVYSTTDGHTRKICERLRDVIERQGHKVRLAELTSAAAIDLAPYDRIVIGASIRYGKHQPAVAEFVERNAATLRSKPSAFFSVNAVARKPEKRDPETNPYVRKFLKSISWKPPLIGIFAGKIDYPMYGFVDKTMIRFIMWMTKGPTDPNGSFEFTDWDAVDAFGHKIGAMGPV